MQDGGFEGALASGLKNVLVHGNSVLRHHASASLANLQCLDRFHSGDGAVSRIWWGDVIKLDDCPCQQVSIGPSISKQSTMAIRLTSTNSCSANLFHRTGKNAINVPCCRWLMGSSPRLKRVRFPLLGAWFFNRHWDYVLQNVRLLPLLPNRSARPKHFTKRLCLVYVMILPALIMIGTTGV